MIKLATVYVKKLNKDDFKSYSEYKNACADNVEAAIKLFRKKVINEGILKECQDRMYYTSKGDKRRKAAKVARRKQLKKMYREKRYFSD